MRVLNKSETISLDEILLRKQGLLVYVLDNKASFAYPITNDSWAFINLGIGSPNHMHTLTKSFPENSFKSFIERLKESSVDKLHWFATMKEFATTALEKGWEFEDEQKASSV